MESQDSLLFLSIVVCTYNRDKYLPEALGSIRAQRFPANRFELVIVNNRSTDDTEQIALGFLNSNPGLNVKYVLEENKGLSFARNRGIKEARGAIIAYVDDDVILSEDYLKAVSDFFEHNGNAVGAGGRVIPKYEHNAQPEWMSKYLNGFIGRVDFGGGVKKFNKKMKYPAGCNMIYKKEILLRAGGFNTELTFRSDDKDIFYRIKKLSEEIYYLPEAWLYHNIDSRRLEYENFKRLFLKTGNEEKKRVKSESGFFGLAKKLVEFVLKFGASLVLFVIFSLKGQSVKGKYVAASQWYTLRGFLRKSVFVR